MSIETTEAGNGQGREENLREFLRLVMLAKEEFGRFRPKLGRAESPVKEMVASFLGRIEQKVRDGTLEPSRGIGWGTRRGLGEYTFEDADLERSWNRLCDAIGRAEDFYVKHL